MHTLLSRTLLALRQNYWFWPSAMTLAAVVFGILLPYLDAEFGSAWIRSAGFIRPTQAEGARAILTTLAGAALGVAGVAFSVTIVAVSFATSNYGPRLIGNFMGDRTNQVVLGIFVATFVYCITVLSSVHTQLELRDATHDAFVPQISILLALLLMLAAVGALITYIHHIPESIDIMNVTARIGRRLQHSVTRMLDEDVRLAARDVEPAAVDAWPSDAASGEPWRPGPPEPGAATLRAHRAGFLQQLDLEGLCTLAAERRVQITLHRAPGDFVVAGETILSATPAPADADALTRRLRGCHTLGANRTDVQDVLFLSDQLVEVLGRALSPGVNDPHTAMLCLDWLHAGLVPFASRSPAPPIRRTDPVRYRRIGFVDMLDRSFDRMRQYIAADRTVTLHALDVLAGVAAAACRPEFASACTAQMQRLATSAGELLDETIARAEIDRAWARSRATVPSPG